MTQETWTAVDRYVAERLLPPDPGQDAVLQEAAAAGLPPISVSSVQGKLLQLLARSHGARSILEIGTLAGYSTIWLARALPADGRLITLEADPKHAAIARANIAKAGFADAVDLRLGAALDLLPKIAGEPIVPFDLIFIDADKPNTAKYFDWALKLSRPGTLIIVDNVVRNGAIVDADSADDSVQGMRRFYDRVAAEARVSATAIQMVGGKGYDGFAMALVTSA